MKGPTHYVTGESVISSLGLNKEEIGGGIPSLENGSTGDRTSCKWVFKRSQSGGENQSADLTYIDPVIAHKVVLNRCRTKATGWVE